MLPGANGRAHEVLAHRQLARPPLSLPSLVKQPRLGARGSAWARPAGISFISSSFSFSSTFFSSWPRFDCKRCYSGSGWWDFLPHLHPGSGSSWSAMLISRYSHIVKSIKVTDDQSVLKLGIKDQSVWKQSYQWSKYFKSFNPTVGLASLFHFYIHTFTFSIRLSLSGVRLASLFHFHFHYHTFTFRCGAGSSFSLSHCHYHTFTFRCGVGFFISFLLSHFYFQVWGWLLYFISVHSCPQPAIPLSGNVFSTGLVNCFR